jgi:hypothetical protein
MDGPRSPCFKRFRELCARTFMELRKQQHKIILLVEMMINGNESLPCFAGNPEVTGRLPITHKRPLLTTAYAMCVPPGDGQGPPPALPAGAP